MQKKPKKLNISSILILLLSLLLLFLASTAVTSIMEYFTTYDATSEEDFAWALESQDYDYILQRTLQNETLGVPSSDALEEYYALGHYYQAALCYRMFAQDGQAEKAARWKEALDAAAAKTGSLSYILPDLDERIEESMAAVS